MTVGARVRKLMAAAAVAALVAAAAPAVAQAAPAVAPAAPAVAQAAPAVAQTAPVARSVNGTELSETQQANIEWVADNVLPALKGTDQQRVSVAATVSWWSLKEGVFSVSSPWDLDLCTTDDGDVTIGPADSCGAGKAWQVGASGIQVPNVTDDQVSSTAAALYPGVDEDGILLDALARSGYAAGSSVAQTVQNAGGPLRRSWMLRDPGLGFTLQEPIVTGECIDDSLDWCFGGWDEAQAFAADHAAITASIQDLTAIFNDQLGDGDPDPDPEPTTAPGTVGNTGGIGLIVRSAPTPQSSSVKNLPTGTAIEIACQVDGPAVTNLSGFTSKLWDSVPAHGGYVADAYIDTGHDGRIPGIPDCASDEPATAPGTVGNTGGIGLIVRSAPTPQSSSVKNLPTGSAIEIACQVEGPAITNLSGFTSKLWDSVPAHGGYVADAYIDTGHDGRIPGIPDCTGDDPPDDPGDPIPGAPVAGIPQPCPSTQSAPNHEFPTNAPMADIVADIESNWNISLVDNGLSWSDEGYRDLLKIWWQTLDAVDCTPFLEQVNAKNNGGLIVRAQVIDDAGTWGEYIGDGVQLINISLQADGRAASVAQNIIHELAHTYSNDRFTAAYYQDYLAIYQEIGGMTTYGQSSDSENFADVVGFYVARCAPETFYTGGEVLPNPYDDAATADYFDVAAAIFDGQEFGPAPGTPASCDP